MSSAEAKIFKSKAIIMDLFSVGIAAIGINHAVNGWRTVKRLRQKETMAEAIFQRKRKEKERIRA